MASPRLSSILLSRRDAWPNGRINSLLREIARGVALHFCTNRNNLGKLLASEESPVPAADTDMGVTDRAAAVSYTHLTLPTILRV